MGRNGFAEQESSEVEKVEWRQRGAKRHANQKLHDVVIITITIITFLPSYLLTLTTYTVGKVPISQFDP